MKMTIENNHLCLTAVVVIDDFIARLREVKISPEMPELFESKEPKV